MNTRLRPESAGTLDPAFADAGVLTFPLNGLPDLEAVAVLALPDKKTLVGFYPFELYGPATVARFHEDGTLDTQFGEGKGFIEIALENAIMAHVIGLSLLEDGAWLLRGTYEREDVGVEGIALVRCLSDGQQDQSFAEKGVRYLRFDQMDKPDSGTSTHLKSRSQRWKKAFSSQANAASSVSMAQQSDGKIVVVFYLYNYETEKWRGIVLRLNADGSSDKTFNDHGFALIEFGNSSNFALGVAIQSDGKILVCGRYNDDQPGLQGGYLTRFDAVGRIDSTFNGGEVFKLKTRWEELNAVSVRESDGLIVAAGAASPVGVVQGALVVLNANGHFNLVFNGGKPLYSPLLESGTHWKNCVAHTDGSIVVGGHGSGGLINGGDSCVVARYRADGSLDPAFNGTGFAVFADKEKTSYYKSMSVMEDGRIIACGFHELDPWVGPLIGGWVIRYLV
ncbi:hypothetical protein [Pseudomonas sp. NPDC087817]|uniref:hypothetical protein n=1 Tax=Pseudomonas sp. NPDC087817 TaxID=3364451 RepID=UPI0037F80EA4